MRTEGFFLLAAAFVLVNGQNSKLSKVGCGTCGECCADGATYQRSATGEETCVTGLPSPSTCKLCGPGAGCVGTTNVGGLFVEALGAGPKGVTVSADIAISLLDGVRAFSLTAAEAAAGSAAFGNVPESMKGADVTRFPWSLPDGFKYTLLCNVEPKDFEGCDVYIMFYRCAGCDTGTPVQLSGALLTAGFKPHKCGPSFTLSPAGQRYNLVVFHKEVARSGSVDEVFLYPSDIEFMAAAYDAKPKLCTGFSEKGLCGAEEGCQWDADQATCRPGWCHLPIGPFQAGAGCPCPKDDQGNLALTA